MKKLIAILIAVSMLTGCITMLPQLQPKNNAPAQLVIGSITYGTVVGLMAYFTYAFSKGYITLPDNPQWYKDMVEKAQKEATK